MNKIKWFAILACLGGMLAFAAPVARAAGEPVAGYFEKDVKYNIYFAVNDGETNSVQNVDIVETVTINNVLFLAVMQKGRQAQDRKGYIRFDKITAIVPSGYWDLKE